jgi:receptor protein-tyrosine kinase
VAGEGKTFTCINLALSIAREHDWTVVLVDADCEKRHITQLFGAEDEPGLMELLNTNLSFESFVMPTDMPGLAVLPAGRRDELAAERLASARMNELCEKIAAADSQRIVIFDSPPLLTSIAPALAMHMGQIVVVVLANKTPRKTVVDALARLGSSKAISLLLNQADSRESMYGGYSGYTQAE